jgi:hypothetical protein
MSVPLNMFLLISSLRSRLTPLLFVPGAISLNRFLELLATSWEVLSVAVMVEPPYSVVLLETRLNFGT